MKIQIHLDLVFFGTELLQQFINQKKSKHVESIITAISIMPNFNLPKTHLSKICLTSAFFFCNSQKQNLRQQQQPQQQNQQYL